MTGETITLSTKAIEDITITNGDLLEVTLADVSIKQVVDEIGIDVLLSEVPDKDIIKYLEEKEMGE